MKLFINGTYRIFARLVCGALLISTPILFQACASGGYPITRQLAKWNNSLSVIPRVLVYIVFIILPIYVITLLVDLIVLNTMDFWSGKVSASNTTYEKDGNTIQVAHTLTPLRNTLITVTAKNGEKTTAEFREVKTDAIEIYVNGIKRGEVKDIKDAMASIVAYNEDGQTERLRQTIDLRSFESISDSNVQLNMALIGSKLKGLRESLSAAK